DGHASSGVRLVVDTVDTGHHALRRNFHDESDRHVFVDSVERCDMVDDRSDVDVGIRQRDDSVYGVKLLLIGRDANRPYHGDGFRRRHRPAHCESDLYSWTAEVTCGFAHHVAQVVREHALCGRLQRSYEACRHGTLWFATLFPTRFVTVVASP